MVWNLNGRVPDEGAVSEAAIAWTLGRPLVAFCDDARSLIEGRINPLLVGLVEFESVDLIADIVPADAEQLSDIAGDEMALVHLRGDVPSGADSTHWRGVTRASGQLLSVAAYAPMDGEFAGEAGRNSLQQMASRTRAASEQLVATRRAMGESNAKQAGLTGALRGLFNRKSSTE